MNDLVRFTIYILFFILTNIFAYKRYKTSCKYYFIGTSSLGAIISLTYCALILDKNPNLILLIIFLLLFQVVIVLFLSSKLFSYKALTIITFLGSLYFLVSCSSYFGEYYLRNNLIVLSEVLESKMAIIINNEYYSLRLRILYLQKYYICVGFKYFFELPEHSYINAVFIVQFFIGKLFDITIFANLGNYLINKYDHLISRHQ